MQGRSKDIRFNEGYLHLDKLIPQDHLLKRIHARIDFSFVNKLTESFYNPNNGRPSILILPRLSGHLVLGI